MATFNVTAPDGRQVKLTGDSPPSEAELEEIFANLPSAQAVAGVSDQPAAADVGIIPGRQTALTETGQSGSELQGALETAATIGTAAIAEPVAGIAGIAGTILPGEPGQGARLVEQTRELLQFTPESPEAERNLAAAGEALAPVAEVLSKLQTGQAAAEAGASPALSTILDTLPIALAEIAGLKGASLLAKGRKAAPGKLDRIEPTVDAEADLQVLSESLNVPVEDLRVMTPDQIKNLEVEAQRGELTQQIEGAADARTRGGQAEGVEAIAEQIQPDPEVLRAAEELGVDVQDIPANVISDNPQFRSLFGAVQSIPASILNEQKKSLMRNLATKAEELVAEAGGDLDVAGRGVALQDEILNNLKDQRKLEERLYTDTKKAIRGDTPVAPTSLVSVLEKRISETGVDNLSPLEKRIWTKVKPDSNPTWTRVDDLRKELNAARFGKGDKAFADADAGELKLYAGLTSGSQRSIAETAGAGDQFKAALEMTGMRKGVEKSAQTLFGKNLDKSLRKTFSGSVENLSKGDVTEFKKVLKAIPEKERQQLLISEIGNKFINPGSEDAFADAAKFSKWFNTLKSNTTARNALLDELPPDFQKKFNAMGKMASVIKRAGEDAITTGRLNTIGEAFKTSNNILQALASGGVTLAKGAAGRTVTPGFGNAVGEVLQAPVGSTAAKAADVFASPAFQRLTAEIASKGSKTNVNKAESVVKRSKQWQDYAASLPKETEAIIGQVGLANWLRSQGENNVDTQ